MHGNRLLQALYIKSSRKDRHSHGLLQTLREINMDTLKKISQACKWVSKCIKLK